MDTWSVTQMLLDAVFTVTIVGIVVGLLYYREKKMYTRFSDMLNRSPEPVSTPRTIVMESPQTSITAVSETVPVRTRAPRTTTTSRPQKPARRAGSITAGRAEKYLEAVRMYRQGSDKGTIEKALGISLMEWELLGRIKGSL
ncbi:MAG: hypothetical protein E4G91_01570 [Candidatus Zixiibacteriota bacterium]|nr:MAG: hypothetical protein E4G91_01570 [candidate division Zixibacteria bacterium]